MGWWVGRFWWREPHTDVVVRLLVKASPGKRHTILLIQVDERPTSRTYHDYESLSQACDGALAAVVTCMGCFSR